MEHASAGISHIHRKMAQIRGDLDSLQEHVDDITLSDDDAEALRQFESERDRGLLLTDEQVGIALGK